MKVYIVTDGYYSSYHIEAVFTVKKKAELYASLHNCWVEEYEADECKIETDKEPKIQWTGTYVWYNENNARCVKMEKEYSFVEYDGINGDFGKSVRVTVTLDPSVSKKVASKIIFDKFTEWHYDHIHDKKPAFRWRDALFAPYKR